MISETDFSRRPACGVLRKKWITIVLCAFAALALHLLLPVFAAGLSQAEPSFAGEVFPWVKIETQGTIETAREVSNHDLTSLKYLAVCAGLFAVCGVMLRAVKGVESLAVQAFVFCSGAVFLISYFFSPVMQSTDVYAYALYGRIFSVYGGNPYDAHPFISDGDPFMPLYDAEYVASWYGPVWTLLSAGIARMTGEHVGLTVLAFRGLSALAALSGAAFLWSGLRRLSPKDATRGLVFFLWNPLLVIETGMSGHNDAIMVAFVLCGVWLHTRGWKAGTVVMLTLSALVKFLTGMLIPLYVLLVLREARGWRERGAFLARSAVGAGAIAGIAIFFAHTGDDVPAAHAAMSPDFYANNFHQLIFNQLRLAFGEDPVTARVPANFSSSWVALTKTAELRTRDDAASQVLRKLSPGTICLVVLPLRSQWKWIYDPESKTRGYIANQKFRNTERPAIAASDPVALRFEQSPMEWPTVKNANRLIRAVTWLGFAAFGLLAAWRTTNFTQFLVWSAASLLASYYFIITEIWPWYPNWALALAAMAPSRLPAKFAMLLSGCTLTLFVTLGYRETGSDWIFRWRSIPAFVFPLAVFIVLAIVQARKKSPHVQPG
jgi:hypothetical protein